MNDQPVTGTPSYTTHNKHKTRISFFNAGFEPAIPAIDNALELTAIVTSGYAIFLFCAMSFA
jgi:hypothetical protein